MIEILDDIKEKIHAVYRASKLPEMGDHLVSTRIVHHGTLARGPYIKVKHGIEPRTGPVFGFEARYFLPEDSPDESYARIIARPPKWSIHEPSTDVSEATLADIVALGRMKKLVDMLTEKSEPRSTLETVKDRGYFDGMRLRIPLSSPESIIPLYRTFVGIREERK